MQINANTPEEYIAQLPEDKQLIVKEVRQAILKGLPQGFAEEMQSGMIGYVVPFSLYPAGYHCNKEQPLPFIALAAQKNFIALYHMGMYVHEPLLKWFQEEYPKHSKTKLDMGKSCIRFKKMTDIPFELITEMVAKLTVEEWIAIYEKEFKKV
jgi:hypothetical protein